MILLDDDGAGKAAARRYREEWFLKADDVITLADVDAKFKGSSLEKLISQATRAAIAQKLGKASPSKKEIGWYLAEICADSMRQNPFDAETTENFELILQHAKREFKKLR